MYIRIDEGRHRMVNWYYVVGSERVGPVSVSALKVLFSNGEITNDTYIWKKGFVNWERLKDVAELKLDEMEIESVPAPVSTPSPAAVVEAEPAKNEDRFELKAPVKKAAARENTREIKIDQLKKEEKTSPEVTFTFSWHSVNEQEELFFIKIGKDRKHDALPSACPQHWLLNSTSSRSRSFPVQKLPGRNTVVSHHERLREA